MLCRNVGKIDRAIRLVSGLILLAAGTYLMRGGHAYGLVFLLIGLAGLVSGITRVCIFYVPFKISTIEPGDLPSCCENEKRSA